MQTATAINHDQISVKQLHSQQHIDVGQYLKSAVYGGLDGTINILAVILGGLASNTSPFHILAIGVSVLIGDGIGMGLGDYLSAKSEKEFIKSEEMRELWEVENKVEEEKCQIKAIYLEKGYTEDQVNRLADLYATNSQAFVNIMMLEQLGLVVDEDSSPVIGGIVTFFAFVVCGVLPLIPYIIGAGIIRDDQTQYLVPSVVIGAVELFALGFVKAILIGLNKIFSGVQSLLLGTFAVGVGYLVALAFHV